MHRVSVVVTDHDLPYGLTFSTTELEPRKTTHGHWHPTPEFYLFFDECSPTLGNEVLAVKPGEVVCVGPNERRQGDGADLPASSWGRGPQSRRPTPAQDDLVEMRQSR